ncbi:ribosomal protection-like ABC-F family protein [Liquorilactobacillus satsumensis]|uniref:ribosomal protection-like ABC-F family protein n=1 Tax=Liquorilactobacillus satsumensis TaxID=259059 RepID=UPI001E41B8D0|nr:ATP-binding cassette domain-containing protein [Liquorilactobacillus satsumensis]MCC7666350.1 ABC-F type ribosomal protection protein [Liquorilactobacillus satsumensis]MCP9358316.1 ABC-F family ATP-binding cassette domain-containing protein [Liquorilactobacillus satsumensis]MCP9372263.1 ABC-F family ATP-binding cassette domain-containing protein [Liquorilactobacillus satsumensis]
MTRIEIKNLTFGFDEQLQPLFKDVSLTLDASWKLGLIGRNGRGKTTFLKLLQGVYPYQGKIKQQLKFNYFPQKIMKQQQTVTQILKESTVAEEWKLERELNLLAVDPGILERSFASLSGGEQTKVLLALLFTHELAYPLIDEPTNHLDLAARKQVMHYLQQKKQGMIVISHDREFMNGIADHILALEKQQPVLYQGNFATYEEEKRRCDEHAQQENIKLKKESTRLRQTALQKAEWAQGRERDKYGSPIQKGSGAILDTGFIGARAARTMKRAKLLVHRMEEKAAAKENLLQNIEKVEPLSLNFRPQHHQVLLRVEQFQLFYADQALFQPLNFELHQGQCLALMGVNGVGKSSLMHYLLGDFAGTSSGEVMRPQKLKLSYLQQKFENNTGTLVEFADKWKLEYGQLLNTLHKLGINRKVFESPLEKMSMGQRKRVELAKSLLTPAELFLWDEPLNYLDVFNREQLEQLIAQKQPTMLLSEHDETFIKNVGAQKVVLHRLTNTN